MFNTIRDLALESVSWLLAFFYELPVVGGSYGFAIMLMTLTVMIILMPLTLRATRSTIKMTQLQPELRALQKKYKDNKAELNPAMMQLYQENGVNPVGGCLPMVAQLPVFLVLFNVLRGLTRRVGEKPYFALSERAHELVGSQITNDRTFDPQYLDQTSAMYQDLTNDTELLFGPFDLSLNAGDVVRDNFFGSFPYIVLILFVVATSYYQQRQVMARRGSQPEEMTQQQQTQQQLLRILPLFSGVTGFFFPAGLVLYWATSNVFRIGQQAYITRSLYSGDGIGAQPIKSVVDDDDDDDDDPSDGTGDGANGSGGPAKSGGKSGAKSDGTSKGSGSNGSASSAGSKKKGSGKKPGSNGSSGSSGDGDGPAEKVDRNEAWAQRRANRTKVKERKQTSSETTSSRVTPKGTQPSASRKKRKR
ncbi:MAG: YidC/Oxa1 family membrane protein insertase [Actinomycetota bacterium]